MRYPAYPAYRSTGFAHWPRVPEHWEAMRIKFVASIGNGSTPSRDESAYWTDGTIPWLNSSVVNQEVVCEADQFVTPAAIRECHLPLIDPPAVLVGITGEGRTRGMATTLAFRTTINQHLAYMKATSPDLDVAFLRRVFDSAYLYLRSESEGGGSTKGAITCAQLAEMSIPMPPHAEQQAIAAFLDWKTSQIDALIARKQALIEKLKEKRLAVITQAVTKGLDSAVPTRSAGLPWLQQVPTHWQVMRFGFRTNVEEGQVDPELEPYCDMWLIAPNHIESHTGRVSGLTSASEQGAISGKYLVRSGDIVYSKIRPHLNKCALADFDGLCSADAYPIRTETELHPPFLLYWMLAQPFLDYATESSMRVAMPKLNRETLSAAPLVVPPLPEQVQIASYLDTATARVASFIEKAESVLDRLTEYRTALITAAVTGQIDVRGVAVPATEWPGKTLGQSTPSMETV